MLNEMFFKINSPVSFYFLNEATRKHEDSITFLSDSTGLDDKDLWLLKHIQL